MVPLKLVFNSEDGIWKSVVEPVLFTLKSVEVAVAVEDAIKKRFVVPPVAPAGVATVS